MKKVFGFTFGGLQKRALALVLVMIAVMVAVFAGISVYQSRMLSDVVGETRREQQRAISQVSSATMHGVLEETLVEITGLQAQIADDDFSEVVSGVRMLCTMAQGLLDNRDEIEPEEVGLPDPALNGQSSAMVLCEEGVDWTQSELLGIIAHMSEPMIAMHRNSEKIDGCYIGLADGTDLCVDDKSLNKLDSSGKPIPFPVRERPWYTGAVEAGGIYFTGIMQDAFSGKYVITCSAPIETDGEVAGVVGIDVVLESMDGFISSSDKSSGYAYIVNESGEVVLGSQGGLFSDESEDWYENEDAERAGLAEFIRRSLGEKTGLTSLTVHQRPFYVVGAPMPTVGWAVITAVERQVTELPEMRMLVEYDRINKEGSAKFQAGNAKTGRTVLLVVALIVAVGAFAAMMAANRMVKPVENMTRDIVLSAQTGQFFEMKDCYRTDDEIELLAEAFANLSKKTKRYIEEITEITREKERANTELQMAALIQNSMLPHIFPPFPDRPEIDLYALMDPAREVGGDFYDFFLIDEDHLCMVMADVSGKGIPAALFMMISKVILKNCAMLGRSAAEILTKTNEALCSGNQAEMFVTVWLGILEISTGKLTAANAGHEYPAVCSGGEYSLFKDRHGFVIGGMEGAKYREYEILLQPGDRLFLYTDGVPEATDADGKMFGTERMIAALNRDAGADPETVLRNVRGAVDDFVEDAEQFDDLTMLCMEYRGKEAEERRGS